MFTCVLGGYVASTVLLVSLSADLRAEIMSAGKRRLGGVTEVGRRVPKSKIFECLAEGRGKMKKREA